MSNTKTRGPIMLIGVVCLLLGPAHAQESKTVLGPSNPELSEGAEALLAGDAEKGVRLSLIGLQREGSRRDRLTGMSNLCAGYIMLEQLETAVSYCSRVLDEDDRHWRAYSNRALAYLKMNRLAEADQDLRKAEAIAPAARNVKVVRSMLRDRTDPVAPSIVIDDRRDPDEDDAQ